MSGGPPEQRAEAGMPLVQARQLVLHLRVMGTPDVCLDDVPLRFRTKKALALLLYLAVTGAPQPPYHLFRRDIEGAILPYAQQHGIGVLVYGPLAHGLLSGGYTPRMTFASDDWRSKSPVFQGDLFARNLAVVERLKGVAERQGITVAQLAIAWVLANPAVDVAIVGARRGQQLEQTAPAADVPLTPETLNEIELVMRDAVPVGGPSPEGM